MHKIKIEKRAQKELLKIPRDDRGKILNAIEALKDSPRPPGCKKLKNRTGYRFRVGNYRIIYDVQDDVLLVVVVKVASRDSVYKDRS